MNNPEIIPTEDTPLSDDELHRVEHHALAMVARDYQDECPQCCLEAPLVVRALKELRELRERIAGACDDCQCLSGCMCS